MGANPFVAPSIDPQYGIEFVMVLGAHLAIAFPDTSLAGGFRCQDEVFDAPADYPCTGFYDCLRNPGDEVVGIGYFPDDNLNFLGASKFRFLDRLRSADYASLITDTIVFILLNRNATLATVHPGGEQEFEECRLFTGDRGNFALSIRTTYLSQSDFERFVDSGTKSVSIAEV